MTADPDAVAAELDRLDALLGEATAAPWKRQAGWNNAGVPTEYLFVPGHNADAKVEMMVPDATLIVESRVALPAAIAEIRLLRAALAHERMCAGLCGDASHRDRQEDPLHLRRRLGVARVLDEEP